MEFNLVKSFQFLYSKNTLTDNDEDNGAEKATQLDLGGRKWEGTAL